MNKLSFFKKLKVYREYKRILNENLIELENRFKIRLDNANRMYTVLNIPEEVIGEAFSIKKTDIDRISDNYIRQYCSELGQYLNSKGMSELYDFYDLKKVDKYSYLIIVGFSIFRSDLIRTRIFKYVLPVSLVVFLIILSFLLFL